MGNIVITDDSSFMRGVIRSILNSYDHTILEAGSGEELLEILPKYDVTLITLDVTLSGMNGVDTLRELRKVNPNVPVIMVSSMGQEPIIVESIQLGANDFIVKPFTSSQLLKSVNKILKKGI